ncbi:Spherulation-specific family 4-domain-containing protein [Mycena olivaceomarginata]|nr:Spherulation-specific family 4-domain-containing protein [Mycena olivaceomarginata]
MQLYPLLGLGVILPLRLGPGTNCAAWTPVSSAITAHPSVHFYIVINPDFSPNSSDFLPNANYRACIPTLRPSSTSTNVLGYVDTATSTTVNSYIDAYAAWNSSYRPNGIMLDHVSATASLFGTYKNYISRARSAGFTFIALDPAAAADKSYFPLVDLINTYEYLYSAFDVASLANSASTPLSKQSVVLTNAPANDSFGTLVSQLDSSGVGAVYITDKGNTDSALPSQWSALVSEIGTLAPSSSSASGPLTATGLTSASASETASPTPPASSSNQSTTSSKSHLGAIIGGVLGAILFFIGVLLIYMHIRRQRLPNSQQAEMDRAIPDEMGQDFAVAPTPFEERSSTGMQSGLGGKGGRREIRVTSPSSPPASSASHGIPPMTQRESESLTADIPAFPPPSYSGIGARQSGGVGMGTGIHRGWEDGSTSGTS